AAALEGRIGPWGDLLRELSVFSFGNAERLVRAFELLLRRALVARIAKQFAGANQLQRLLGRIRIALFGDRTDVGGHRGASAVRGVCGRDRGGDEERGRDESEGESDENAVHDLAPDLPWEGDC